jgi:molybdopterin/thiamine biosynthesis adenylyltransferase
LKKLNPTSCVSPISIKATGVSIAGALIRQQNIAGFDQDKYSRSHVLCIGAGGLMSNIAPTLVRKGIGQLTILDHDEVEVSNLNRQRFYKSDIGQNKAIALVRNLQRECTHSTVLIGHPISLETAIYSRVNLWCDLALCGVDNNPARLAASKFFRQLSIPVVFTAVSANADHGYVFIQRPTGPCIACALPHVVDEGEFPCPGVPAIADILQAVGAFSSYAVDAVITGRRCNWNYRTLYLSSGEWEAALDITEKESCALHAALKSP